MIFNLAAGATFFSAVHQKRITAASNSNMAKQGNNQIKATRYASVPPRLTAGSHKYWRLMNGHVSNEA
jgi:hypothetical protein